MPVQVTKIENKTTTSGQNYKYIELSNGVKGSMWATSGMGNAKHDTVGYAEIQVGQSGEAEVTSNEKNGKTYQNIISWVPSERPPSGSESPAGQPTDWAAKDRAIGLQAQSKVAGEVVAAMIAAGILKTEPDIMRCLEGIATNLYGLVEDARQGTLVYPGMEPPDPFADQ